MRSAFNPMGVIDMAKDYIIDYGNNSNGWYRKWKSGFIEQWGDTSTSPTILPISFSNTNYTIIFSFCCVYGTKNLNNFYITDWNFGTASKPNHSTWYACGY